MTQNSFAHRANQAYRGAAVAVPPLRAVVMLFDGTIMNLQRMLEAQDAGRFEEAHGHLMRATAILRGLSHHLDMSRGGALAERLFKTYNALILACHRSFGRARARDNFGRIIKSLGELREAWQHVNMTMANSAPVSRQSV
jgi:flagellar secretion chaperone FliS